ncbi:MarR family winged helix-turn-helix transcriptional regulator [Nocardia sp. XZ_19_231]|uniref:MarR family winged helix-turn-helix transcriptional regulator n=1 Tax=Nocardia sp. XZ_19_231 TaxID=2769252 RepID=UPI00188E7609|nr:MarR family winged helix-turn-helix transcriptional regulator [Nocardia sp. XZ_19_231]
MADNPYAARDVEEGGKTVNDTIDEIDEQLMGVLRSRRRIFHESAERVHPSLQPAAVGFLIRLDAVGPSRPSDLAAYFRIGKATAGRQLSALEELGLVDRRPDPEDGRAQLLALTELGKRRLDETRTTRRTALRERLSSWPESDLASLAELLRRLNVEFAE